MPRSGHEKQASAAWMPWLVWGLGALLFFYGFFQRVAPSVMIDHLMRDLAVGGALLGNLSALYFYAYAGLQIPVGVMADRWGPRRLLTGGALACGSGSLLFAQAEGLWSAYAGRLLIGIGASFGLVATLKLATAWFPSERFAQVTGLTITIGMLGGIAGQAPLAALVELFGWRSSLAAAAVFGLVLALLTWLVVRDRPGGVPEAKRSGPDAVALLADLRSVVRAPQNLILALICAAMTAPILGFAGLWGVSWLMQTRDLARPEAAAMTSLILLGVALGSPLFGTLSDRIGRRKPPLLCGLGLGLVSLSALIHLPPAPLWLIALLFPALGLGLGAMVISYAAARESNPGGTAGLSYAFVNCAAVASGAVFQPLIGWLLDLQWDGASAAGARVYAPEAYRWAFSALVLFLLFGLGAGLRLRETHPRSCREKPG